MTMAKQKFFIQNQNWKPKTIWLLPYTICWFLEV